MMWGPGNLIKKVSSVVSIASDRSSQVNSKNWPPTLVDDLTKNSFGEIVGEYSVWSIFQRDWERQGGNISINTLIKVCTGKIKEMRQ